MIMNSLNIPKKYYLHGDGVHDYIAENGATKNSDHNIHKAVEEFIEEHF